MLFSNLIGLIPYSFTVISHLIVIFTLLELLLNIPATTAPQAAAVPEFIDMKARMSFDLSTSDVIHK